MRENKILSVYVSLKLGRYYIATVCRSNGKYKNYKLTPSSYFRLERICEERAKLDPIRNRVGATHYSLIINTVPLSRS